MAHKHFFPDWNCLQWFLGLLCTSLVPAGSVRLTDLATSYPRLDLSGPNQLHHEFWSYDQVTWVQVGYTGKLHDLWFRCSQFARAWLRWRTDEGWSSCLRFHSVDGISLERQSLAPWAISTPLQCRPIASCENGAMNRHSKTSGKKAQWLRSDWQHVFKLKWRMWKSNIWILEEKALIEISKVGVFLQRNSSFSDFSSTAKVAKCARHRRSSVSTQCTPVSMEFWLPKTSNPKRWQIFPSESFGRWSKAGHSAVRALFWNFWLPRSKLRSCWSKGTTHCWLRCSACCQLLHRSSFEVAWKTLSTMRQTCRIKILISFMKSPAYTRKVHRIQLGLKVLCQSRFLSAKMIDWISRTPGGLPMVRKYAWFWIVGLQCPEHSYNWNFAIMLKAFKNLPRASKHMAFDV